MGRLRRAAEALRREPGALLCFGGILLVFVVTLPVTLTEGDAGEWLVIARYGGIPHPSGYPLYALLCRLAALVAPPLPLVTAVALVSALCAAAAAGITYRALRSLDFAPTVSASATFAVFLSGGVWRIANMPEPFALNLLLASLVVWLAARAVAVGDRRSAGAGWLGLVFGLGFCNHHSLVWMAPLGLVLLLRAGGVARATVRFVAGFGLGALPLVYLGLARDDGSPYDYYAVDSLGDLVKLVMRTTYGTFRLAPNRVEANWGSVAHYFAHLPGWLTWIFLFVVLWGIVIWVHRVCQASRAGERWLLAAWALSFVGASIVFLRMFNVRVDSWIPAVIERFMALPSYLLVVPMAAGVAHLAALIERRRAQAVVPVMVAALLIHGVAQSGRANRMSETFYENHVYTMFEISHLGGNVLFTTSDAEALAALHGRYILGLGGERFLWLNAAHWRSERFRRRMVEQFGVPGFDVRQSLTQAVDALLAFRGRVVVADLPLPPLPRAFAHSYVLGPTTILVRASDPLPTAAELWALNRALFADETLPDCAAQRRLNAWDRALWGKYIDGLGQVIDALRAAGRPDLVREAEALRVALAC